MTSKIGRTSQNTASKAVFPLVKRAKANRSGFLLKFFRTGELSIVLLLLVAAVVTSPLSSSSLLHCMADTTGGSSFSLQYSYSTSDSGKTYTDARAVCTNAGMTLPIVDSAAKNAELANFMASSGSMTELVGPYAFLSSGVTADCAARLASGSCYVYRIEKDGTPKNVVRMTGNGSFAPVSGQYNNFLAGTLNLYDSHVTVDKKGTWSGAVSAVKVPYVICESSSTTAAVETAAPKKSNTNVIVGAVIGSICGVALIAGLIVLACCLCSDKKEAEEVKPPASGKQEIRSNEYDEESEEDEIVKKFALRSSRRASCNSRRSMNDSERVQPLSSSILSVRSTRSAPVVRLLESGSDEDALHEKVKRFVDAVKRVQKKYPSFMPTICAALYRDPNANKVVTRALEENPLAKPLMRLAFDLAVSDEEKRQLNNTSNHADLERDMLQFLDDTNDEFTTPENSTEAEAFADADAEQ